MIFGRYKPLRFFNTQKWISYKNKKAHLNVSLDTCKIHDKLLLYVNKSSELYETRLISNKVVIDFLVNIRTQSHCIKRFVTKIIFILSFVLTDGKKLTILVRDAVS